MRGGLLTPLPPRVRFRLGSVLLRKPCIGYSMRWFWLQQLPAGCSPLFAAGRTPTFSRADADAGWGECAAGRAIDGLHQAMELALLVVIGIHIAGALIHIFVYRDRIMQRMLP